MKPTGPTSVGPLPMRFGVPIGQVIDFRDSRVTTVGAYPGQVRCHFVQLDPETREPTGKTRTRTVPRAEYDKWIADARPGGMPKPVSAEPPSPATGGRRVKIMRVSPSGHPAVIFEAAAFEAIAAGDVFVVLEADGTEVPGGPWVAGSAARRETSGAWAIDADPIKLEDLEPSTTDAPVPGDPNLVV